MVKDHQVQMDNQEREVYLDKMVYQVAMDHKDLKELMDPLLVGYYYLY